MEHFEKKEVSPNLDDTDYLKQEMIKAINTLPHKQTKKFYHLMMAELTDMGY